MGEAKPFTKEERAEQVVIIEHHAREGPNHLADAAYIMARWAATVRMFEDALREMETDRDEYKAQLIMASPM